MIDQLISLLQRSSSDLINANGSNIAEELKATEDGTLSVSLGIKLKAVGPRLYAATSVSYSRKFKDELEDSIEIPDPNQPELMDSEEMTASSRVVKGAVADLRRKKGGAR